LKIFGIKQGQEFATCGRISRQPAFYLYHRWIHLIVFHHIIGGAFSAPITGSKQFSPSSTIYLQSVDATLSAAAASNVKFTLRKSGSTDIDSFTITAGNTTFNSTVSSSAASTITSSDYVTMNIDSGAGNTLAVKVTYLG